MEADCGEPRIHQNDLFAIVEADQTDLLRHLHPAPAQRSPKSVSDFVVAGYDSSGSRPPRKDSSGAHLAEIDETQWIAGSDHDEFELVLAHSFSISSESAIQPRLRNI